MKDKIEIFVNIVLILLLPFMFYINISDSPINISLGDLIFPLSGLLIIIQYKRLIEKKRWIYILYFLGLILSILLSHIIIQSNKAIISVAYMTMSIEIVKTAIVGGYFYIAYMFIKDSRRYKLALYTLSLGSIPVGFIAVGAYVSHLLGNPFFIEIFALQEYSSRLVGTFEDPNLYAFYLIMIFYISLWNSRTIRNKIVSFGMILISVFSAILLVMTMSRSGWIAFVVSLLISATFNIRKITKQSVTICLTFIFIILLGIQLDYSLQEGKIVKTVTERIENSLIKGDEGDRFQLSKAALEMGNDNFIFGVGKGNFPLNSYIYLGEDNINYQRQLIPHNTLFGIYAQQGILGLTIFLMLPIYLLYKLIKTNRDQNRYIIPLLIGFLIHSFAINIENVRFVWFLFGMFLASYEFNTAIEICEQRKWNAKRLTILNFTLLFFIIGLFINISRYFYINIFSYGNKIVEKTINVPQEDIYTLSFDIWTNNTENKVEVYENNKLLKSFTFKSAYGKVEESIELNNNVTVKFVSNEDGWMRINNAYISNRNSIIPLYSYPLIPSFLINSVNRNNLLVYSNEPSLKQELDITSKNSFDSFEVLDTTVNKYSNLTLMFDTLFEYKKEIDFDHNLNLRLEYDSISDLLPNELQRNMNLHYMGVYSKNIKRSLGDTYHLKSYKLLSSIDFKLYGQFYDIENKAYHEGKFFEIPFDVIENEQDIINPGEREWINVRYRINDQNQIIITNNGWVETKRYHLDSGEYNISFKAQGSSLDGEYSTIRIRDSYLNEVAVIDLDGSNREYSIPYTVSEKEEGISFILELINFERNNDNDRRILLEDWVKIEKVD